MNSFKLFGCKRTCLAGGRELEIFSSVEGFFELHSRATEGKKDKNRTENGNFSANLKSLNEFNIWIKYLATSLLSKRAP